jgi:hypothetical protein
VTDRGLSVLASGCPNLRFVNVSWNEAVTSAGLQALLHGCDQLDCLIVEGVKRLTDDGLLSALSAGTHDSLRRLDLSWVNTCDTALVLAIQAAHPYLEVVDYYTNSHSARKHVPALMLADTSQPESLLARE